MKRKFVLKGERERWDVICFFFLEKVSSQVKSLKKLSKIVSMYVI